MDDDPAISSDYLAAKLSNQPKFVNSGKKKGAEIPAVNGSFEGDRDSEEEECLSESDSEIEESEIEFADSDSEA